MIIIIRCLSSIKQKLPPAACLKGSRARCGRTLGCALRWAPAVWTELLGGGGVWAAVPRPPPPHKEEQKGKDGLTSWTRPSPELGNPPHWSSGPSDGLYEASQCLRPELGRVIRPPGLSMVSRPAGCAIRRQGGVPRRSRSPHTQEAMGCKVDEGEKVKDVRARTEPLCTSRLPLGPQLVAVLSQSAGLRDRPSLRCREGSSAWWWWGRTCSAMSVGPLTMC